MIESTQLHVSGKPIFRKDVAIKIHSESKIIQVYFDEFIKLENDFYVKVGNGMYTISDAVYTEWETGPIGTAISSAVAGVISQPNPQEYIDNVNASLQT